MKVESKKEDLQDAIHNNYFEFCRELKKEENAEVGNKTEEKLEENNKQKIELQYEKSGEHIDNLIKITEDFLDKPFLCSERQNESTIKSACLYPDKSKVIAALDNEFGSLLLYSILEKKKTLFTIPELKNNNLPDKKTKILAVAISKCGDKLLFGGTKGNAGILNIVENKDKASQTKLTYDIDLSFDKTGKKPNELTIRAVKFSKDDEDAIIGRDDGFLLIYRLSRFKNEKNEEKLYINQLLHKGGLCAISICPSSENDWIATGGNDKKIKISKVVWNSKTLEIHKTLTNHTGIVRSLAFSSNGDLLLSGSYDKTAKSFDTNTWEEIRTFSGHKEEVYSVAISPDKKFILTGSKDNRALLFDRETGEILATYVDKEEVEGKDGELKEFKEYDIRVVLFVGDGSIIMTCGEHGILNFYKFALGQHVRKHSRHGDDSNESKVIRSLDFWNDKILTGGEDSTVRLYDKETGFEIRRFEGHKGSVYCVAFSTNGRVALSGGEDCILRIFDVITGSLLRHFQNHTEYISILKYSPSEKEIITGGGDEALYVYDSFKGDKPLFQFLNDGDKDIKIGRMDCIEVYSPNKEDKSAVVLIIGGLNKENNSVLNVYKYSRQINADADKNDVERINHILYYEFEGKSVDEDAVDLKLINENQSLVVISSIKGKNRISLHQVESLLINKERHFFQEILLDSESINPLKIAFHPDTIRENLSFLLLSELTEQKGDEKNKKIVGYDVSSWIIDPFIPEGNTHKANLTKNIYRTENIGVDMYTLKIIKKKVIFGTVEGIPAIKNIEDAAEESFSRFSAKVRALSIPEEKSNESHKNNDLLAVIYESQEIMILDAHTGRLKHNLGAKGASANFMSVNFMKFTEGKLLVVSEKIIQSSEQPIITQMKVLDKKNNFSSKEEEFELGHFSITAIEIKNETVYYATNEGKIYSFLIEKWREKHDQLCCLFCDYTREPPINCGHPKDKPVVPIIAICPVSDNEVYLCFKNGRMKKYTKVTNTNTKKIDLVTLLSKKELDDFNCACSNPPNYTHLITGGTDSCVKIIELKTLKENIFTGHSKVVVAVGFFYENSYAISASEDKILKIFEVESGAVIYEFDCQYKITSICVSPSIDTVYVGTEYGLHIMERVINTHEKLLYFQKIMKKIKPIDSNFLEKHDFKDDDISIAPYPLNLSLLNILTMLSGDLDQLNLIKSTSKIISEYLRGRGILLKSIFRREQKFGSSPWDLWSKLKYKNKISYLLDIVTFKGLTGLEKMRRKDIFINEVANIHPGKLHLLLDSFWEELDPITLPIYRSKWIYRYWRAFKRLFPWTEKKNSYEGSANFPIFLVGETALPSDRYIERKYKKSNLFHAKEKVFKYDYFNNEEKKESYCINAKVSVSLIKLDEIFISEKSTGNTETFLNIALPVLEQFEPDHSVFRSKLLDCLVNFLFHHDNIYGIVFYRNMILSCLFIALICINLMFLIPFREGYRLPDYDGTSSLPEEEKICYAKFIYYKWLSFGFDVLIITILFTVGFLYQIYWLYKLHWKKQSVAQGKSQSQSGETQPKGNQRIKLSYSKSSRLSIVNSIIGIVACILDIFWGQTLDQNNSLAISAKIFLAIFFLISWFKLIEFSIAHKKTSSLVRILYKVTIDMLPFFLIIIFMLLGTASFTFILQSSYDDYNLWKLIKNFYFVITGDHDEFSALETKLDETLFFFILFAVTIFIVIFMFNLLISIISDSHAEVRSKEDQNIIYEKIKTINRRFEQLTDDQKIALREALKDKFIFKLEKVIDEEDEESLAEKSRINIQDIKQNTDEMKRELKREHSKRFEAIESKLVKLDAIETRLENMDKVLSKFMEKVEKK